MVLQPPTDNETVYEEEHYRFIYYEQEISTEIKSDFLSME